MKQMMKALALAGALVALAPLAHAASISGSIGFGGNGTYDATTNMFTVGANGGDSYVNVKDSNMADSLSVFTKFNPATFYTFNSMNSGAKVFQTSENGITLTFNLSSFIADGTNVSGGGFTGTGILTETGYDPTMASFSLNTNANAGTFITFNTTTAAPTPEPSSLILLGTGVLGAAGMLRRRFSGKSNA